MDCCALSRGNELTVVSLRVAAPAAKAADRVLTEMKTPKAPSQRGSPVPGKAAESQALVACRAEPCMPCSPASRSRAHGQQPAARQRTRCQLQWGGVNPQSDPLTHHGKKWRRSSQHGPCHVMMESTQWCHTDLAFRVCRFQLWTWRRKHACIRVHSDDAGVHRLRWL